MTWWRGIPSSSSHALIGGVIGAVVVASGFDAVIADGLIGEVLVPAVIAPILALTVAGAATFVAYRRIRDRDPDETRRSFRVGQVASASLVALSHGTNDAQKTMGVITLALDRQRGPGEKGAGVPGLGRWSPPRPRSASGPTSAAGASSRRSATGSRKLETPQGFSSETSSAVVILAASQAGFPLSTTHVTSGGVMGAGVGRRAAAVNWSPGQRMVFAWLVTIPAAAVIAGACYLVVEGIGRRARRSAGRSASLAALGATALFAAAQRANPVTARDV